MKSICKYMHFRPEFFDNFLLRAALHDQFNDAFDAELGDYWGSLSGEDKKAFYDAMPGHYIDDYIMTYYDIQAGVRASIGSISFSANYNNLLMWAHYADNHRGLCVEYDYNSEFFHGRYSCGSYEKVGKIHKVEYSKERPVYITHDELVSRTDYWFHKSWEWRYEEEYRILLPIDEADKRSGFGDDCEDPEKVEVCEKCKSSDEPMCFFRIDRMP